MQEEGCEGFEEGEDLDYPPVDREPGRRPYNEAGEQFKAINLHPPCNKLELNPQQMEMYYVACYDIDRFREFVFDSSFLDKYEVEPETVEAMREDDEALLQFGFRWLRTCLFNEQTVKLREETRAQYEARLAAQGVKRDK